MSLVLDASMALSWAFRDETTPGRDRVLERVGAEGALVPALWRYEVANGMLTAFRRGRISGGLRTRFLGLLEQLPIETVLDVPKPAELVQLAQQSELSTYDAAYLVLALERGVDLATLDAALAEAATRAGLAVAGDEA